MKLPSLKRKSPRPTPTGKTKTKMHGIWGYFYQDEPGDPNDPNDHGKNRIIGVRLVEQMGPTSWLIRVIAGKFIGKTRIIDAEELIELNDCDEDNVYVTVLQ